MLLKFICGGRHAISSCDIALYTNTLFNTKNFSFRKNKMTIRSKVTINFTIFDMTYYDWYIIKIISIIFSCKSNIVLIKIIQYDA